MSRYNRETGVIKFNQQTFRTFKKQLLTAFNLRQSKFLEQALELHDRVNLAAKGKRGFDKSGWVSEQIRIGQDRQGYNRYTYNVKATLNEIDALKLSLFGHQREGRMELDSTKLRKPKKTDFPHHKATGSFSFDCDEGVATLSAKDFCLHWNVQQNNHAVEDAHDSPMGVNLFSALSRVKWGRASGGVLRYEDEYSRDAAIENGGSSSSISYAYGSIGKAEEKSQRGW